LKSLYDDEVTGKLQLMTFEDLSGDEVTGKLKLLTFLG